MKKLVRPLHRKVVCDIRACRNMATYAVGLEGFTALYINLCPDCFSEIISQGSELMYGKEKSDTVSEKTDAGKAEETDDSKTDAPVEYYVCSACGEKFLKPDQLSAYRSHVAKHNKGVRSAGAQLKEMEKNLKVKAPTVRDVIRENDSK